MCEIVFEIACEKACEKDSSHVHMGFMHSSYVDMLIFHMHVK